MPPLHWPASHCSILHSHTHNEISKAHIFAVSITHDVTSLPCCAQAVEESGCQNPGLCLRGVRGGLAQAAGHSCRAHLHSDATLQAEGHQHLRAEGQPDLARHVASCGV